MYLPSIPEVIINLPLSTYEINNRSRKLHGGHIYISRWHRCFKGLQCEEQNQLRNALLFGAGKSVETFATNVSDEEVSIDSTDSRIDAPITVHERMRLAWRSWSYQKLDSKEAWKQRATYLNGRPIPGILTQPPHQYSITSFASSVYKSMAIEWQHLVALFRRTILFPRSSNEFLTKTYMFGNENVIIGAQCFRYFRLSHLIALTLFGPNFSKVETGCVIKRTKRVAILHIDTMDRMQKLFTIANECAVQFHSCKNGFESVQSCCGKVRVEKDGKSIGGYLIDENNDGDKWEVHLLNDETIFVNKVKFDEMNECYVYEDNTNSEGYRVAHYNPIRLYIGMGRAQSRLTLNRVGFDKANKIISNYSS